MIPRNQVRKAGKQIAEGNVDATNLRIIEAYRESFDDALIGSSDELNSLLVRKSLRFLLSGRPKRIKSIVRKLIRAKNMDVTNMADMIGIRILVSDITMQDEIIKILCAHFGPSTKLRDYRNRENGYRSVHLITRIEGKQLEIQVRTLIQHIWAVESESFGDTVKGGGGDTSIRTYLDEELAVACKALEESNQLIEFEGSLWNQRNPTTRFLSNIRRLFNESTSSYTQPRQERNYVVVFDRRLSFLTRLDVITDNRKHAIDNYRRLVSRVDEDRFDIVLLNSRSSRSIALTHPNFFPRVKFGQFDDVVL